MDGNDETQITATEYSVCLPVYEDYDEHDESHYGGPYPDSHLSLHRKCRLSLAVVLHSAQREVQIPHFHLKNKTPDFSRQDPPCDGHWKLVTD